MKSVLLNYAKPINKATATKAYVYDAEKSVNVCIDNHGKVFVENCRQDTELKTKTEAAREQDDEASMELYMKTKTEAAREQDDDIPMDLCLKTKTFANMEQDDQGAVYYQ